MLNKNLGKLAIVLILSFTSVACGQNETPNGSKSETTTQNNSDSKKFSSNKWAEFQQGFNKKKTVTDSIRNGRVKVQMDSIEKEYNVKKYSMSDRIDPEKWKEFQIAFTTRAKYYINNISDAFN